MSLRLNENTFCGSEYTKLLPSTHILIWEGEIGKKIFFLKICLFDPKIKTVEFKQTSTIAIFSKRRLMT